MLVAHLTVNLFPFTDMYPEFPIGVQFWSKISHGANKLHVKFTPFGSLYVLSVFPPVRFAPKNADTITISLFLFTYKFGDDRSSNTESEFSCAIDI